MSYKCKITVLRKEFFPDLVETFIGKPNVGRCDKFQEGQEFMVDFKTYFNMGIPEGFCSEAWESIQKYVFTHISGGTVFKGWPKDDGVAIACCNDGVRPVIFKLERIEAQEEKK